MTRPFFCYHASYLNDLIQWNRIDIDRIVPIYVCLHRKKDGEAWRVTEAWSIGPRPVGTRLTYRDNSVRDFDARVISKAEYDTFKIFETEGKR